MSILRRLYPLSYDTVSVHSQRQRPKHLSPAGVRQSWVERRQRLLANHCPAFPKPLIPPQSGFSLAASPARQIVFTAWIKLTFLASFFLLLLAASLSVVSLILRIGVLSWPVLLLALTSAILLAASIRGARNQISAGASGILERSKQVPTVTVNCPLHSLQ